jgi:hypothetical protein
MVKKLTLVLALLLFLFSIGFAENTYDTNLFDDKVESLPANYMGYDIKQLYEELKQKFPPKDEFETKDTYIKRLQSEEYNNLYAFKIEDRYGFYSTYNADNENLNLKFQFSSTSSFDRNSTSIISYITLTTKTIEGNKTTYMASNAYGKEVEVAKHTGDKYGISLISKNIFPLRFMNDYQINLKMTPDKAKELKDNTGVLLICKLGLPKNNPAYIFESTFYAKPTISLPIELSYQQHFLFVTMVKEIWVYNFVTGEIVKKVVIYK